MRRSLTLLLLCLASASALAVDYTDSETWLCRPENPRACAADQTTTIIHASGALEIETFTADPDTPIDCFYVYPRPSRPTSSTEPVSPEEVAPDPASSPLSSDLGLL